MTSHVAGYNPIMMEGKKRSGRQINKLVSLFPTSSDTAVKNIGYLRKCKLGSCCITLKGPIWKKLSFKIFIQL